MAFGASVKFLKTLGKHISLDIAEMEEEKEENHVLYAFVRLP